MADKPTTRKKSASTSVETYLVDDPQGDGVIAVEAVSVEDAVSQVIKNGENK